MEESWQVILSVCLGLGLSAACGFRVFIPLLAMSIVRLAAPEWLTLAEGFEWIGTWPALVAFAVATVLEIAAYYVPWLDNLLDTMATPTSVVAGIVVTASCITTMHPLLKWTLAVIAGGGAAGVVQGGTSLLRLASTSLTGGMGNWVVATLETVGSVAMTILAFVVAPLAMLAALVMVLWLYKRWSRWRVKPEPA